MHLTHISLVQIFYFLAMDMVQIELLAIDNGTDQASHWLWTTSLINIHIMLASPVHSCTHWDPYLLYLVLLLYYNLVLI